MQNHLADLDARITQASVNLGCVLTATFAAGAVTVSQLVIRAQADDAPAYSSEAEQFGASMASGIVEALTAPLLYGALAMLVTFPLIAVYYRLKRDKLVEQRAQVLARPYPQPVPRQY